MSKSREEIRDAKAMEFAAYKLSDGRNFVEPEKRETFKAGFDAGLATADAEHAEAVAELLEAFEAWLGDAEYSVTKEPKKYAADMALGKFKNRSSKS